MSETIDIIAENGALVDFAPAPAFHTKNTKYKTIFPSGVYTVVSADPDFPPHYFDRLKRRWVRVEYKKVPRWLKNHLETSCGDSGTKTAKNSLADAG